MSKKNKPMSLQRIFDTAGVGMLKQGKMSTSPKGTCQYRGEKGCKCAVGFLIPDDMYDSAFEGVGICELVVSGGVDSLKEHALREVLDQLGVSEFDQMRLLCRLQSCHDRAWRHDEPSIIRDEWHQDLTSIARDFELSTKSIDKVMEELEG